MREKKLTGYSSGKYTEYTWQTENPFTRCVYDAHIVNSIKPVFSQTAQHHLNFLGYLCGYDIYSTLCVSSHNSINLYPFGHLK